jgi:hypothetical protein
MKSLIVACIYLFSAICHAEALPSSAKVEIEYLIAHLGGSSCQFNRNGSWYSAPEAVAHINKKYQYLVGKNQLSTTESFIEKAATASSMSGKSYQVKCENQPVVLSAVWFSNALHLYRKKNKNQ